MGLVFFERDQLFFYQGVSLPTVSLCFPSGMNLLSLIFGAEPIHQDSKWTNIRNQ
jgi:hypothetical protein